MDLIQELILLSMIASFIWWLMSLKETKESDPKLCTRCNSGLPVLPHLPHMCPECEFKENHEL